MIECMRPSACAHQPGTLMPTLPPLDHGLAGLLRQPHAHANFVCLACMVWQDFLGNRIDTGWLDKLIASQMQLQPPDARDVAMCGALLKAHLAIEATRAKVGCRMQDVGCRR